MTTSIGAWRYLLRNGRFFTASVQLAQKHLLQYVTREGAVVFALLSSATERLLLQLQGLEVDLVITSPTTSSTSKTCPATSRKLKPAQHKSRDKSHGRRR